MLQAVSSHALAAASRPQRDLWRCPHKHRCCLRSLQMHGELADSRPTIPALQAPPVRPSRGLRRGGAAIGNGSSHIHVTAEGDEFPLNHPSRIKRSGLAVLSKRRQILVLRLFMETDARAPAQRLGRPASRRRRDQCWHHWLVQEAAAEAKRSPAYAQVRKRSAGIKHQPPWIFSKAGPCDPLVTARQTTPRLPTSHQRSSNR